MIAPRLISTMTKEDTITNTYQRHQLGLDAYGVDDARFLYQPRAVDCSDSDFNELKGILVNNPKQKVKVFGNFHHPKTGKPYTRPRHEAVYGKDYTYSGTTLSKESTTNTLVTRVMRHANGGEDGGPFTWALVNLYLDGDDNVGMHQDNEEDVCGTTVRTYSFGATRKFVLREKKRANKKRKNDDRDGKRQDMKPPVRVEFQLEHGSCGIMTGPEVQRKWEHGVPVQKRVKMPRISITPRA